MSLQNINIGGSGMPSVGTILAMSNQNSPIVYNAIGNVGNIKVPNRTLDADTTNQGVEWTQGVPTINSGDVLTFDLFFIPASEGQDMSSGIVGHSFEDTGAVGNVQITRDTRQYSLTWPDGSARFFSAYFTQIDIDSTVKDVLKASCQLKVTGEVTSVDA